MNIDEIRSIVEKSDRFVITKDSEMELYTRKLPDDTVDIYVNDIVINDVYELEYAADSFIVYKDLGQMEYDGQVDEYIVSSAFFMLPVNSFLIMPPESSFYARKANS